MIHEETIKRIQELVPSVMEIEEGCIIRGGGIIMAEGCVYWNTPEGVFAYDNADGFEDEDVLGKPITLAVVLRALDESKNRSFVYCIEIKKWVETESNNAVKLFYIIATSWNLSKDNFNDQTEETKTFIGGLLGIKYT